MSSLLFVPMELRGVKLRNRIVLPPMLTYQAQNGCVNDWHLIHYGKYAIGGVGLVFMESTKVDPRGCTTPNDLGLWKDEFIGPLQRITAFLKSHGAAAGIQLGHSGRKARNSLPWNGRGPLDSHPGVDRGEAWDLIAPSAIAHNAQSSVPHAMTMDEIHEQVEAWGQAAERADRAGFDVLEVHGAHGYLLHQFLSAQSNQREDSYGGSLENRMRFAVDVVERIRQSWPVEKPLFFRVSAVDETGWSIADSVELARVLKTCGVDVFDCSSGGMSATRNPLETGQPPRYGYQVPYAAEIRKGAGIQTMAVGLIIHSDQAEEILTSGAADLVAIGREMLHNPNWPLDAAEKLGDATPYTMLPNSYGYWLGKRTQSGFGGRPSTWQVGIEHDEG
ncbi:MAG: NADH:flavin oxidoreductase/NADH oxidase [Gammaproteobacteria bacterium]|nr:NADH:flavin oxidoreductase/NADH oxidase [Gammaproteobacteria bacterium]